MKKKPKIIRQSSKTAIFWVQKGGCCYARTTYCSSQTNNYYAEGFDEDGFRLVRRVGIQK